MRPIILAALLIGNALASQPIPLGLLSLAGACYISWLAWESFTIRVDDRTSEQMAKSLRKGVLTNFLNPHPYLFWMTVGTPLPPENLGIPDTGKPYSGFSVFT